MASSYAGGKPRISYFYDSAVGSYYYGAGHPMKPHRLRMTHALVLAYGMYKKMEIYRPHPCSATEMLAFHSADYVDFLQRLTPDNAKDYLSHLSRYNIGAYTDCFDETHQLLTRNGFKFVNELTLNDELATYNSETREIEYHHPNGMIVKGGSHTMIDVTETDKVFGTDKIQMDQKALQSNTVSLSTTAGHNWYVRFPSESNQDSDEYRIVKASALLNDNSVGLSNTSNSFNVLSIAPSGYWPTMSSLAFVDELSLTSSNQINAFLELYGYWLRLRTSMHHSHDQSQSDMFHSINFPQVENTNSYLIDLIQRLPLIENTDYTIVDDNSRLQASITKNEWVNYFSAKYNHKTAHSHLLDLDNQIDPSVKLMNGSSEFFDWVRFLNTEQSRFMIKGLSVNRSSDLESGDIYTSSMSFRDEVVHSCIHAGYAVYFSSKRSADAKDLSLVHDYDPDYVWHIQYSDDATSTEHLIVSSTGVKERHFNGNVYCVDVPNHLIFARRAVQNMFGMVTEASATIITGNCPIFDGLFDYCSLYSGGSLDGAHRLNIGETDIAINWSGGLHHAKKSEASGFCYINDIVLGILELLKYHPRVLYIDIDIHHGDGVEEAFYTTNRVCTVSFHKYGDFFPGTGNIKDCGANAGKNYSINVPLAEGMDDAMYLSLFKPIMSAVIASYQPSVIVLQCGADSLWGDRLGCWNLTVKGHGECVKYITGFRIPTLVVGGGGYNIRNVSRCWTYETAVCAQMQLNPNLPNNDFIHYYGPDFRLHYSPSDELANANTKEQIERIKAKVLDTVSRLEHAPSVQMHHVPSDDYIKQQRAEYDDERKEVESDVGIRYRLWESDKRVEKESEYYDEEMMEGEEEVTKRSGGRKEQILEYHHHDDSD